MRSRSTADARLGYYFALCGRGQWQKAELEMTEGPAVRDRILSWFVLLR
jgi:hypothetical protein